MSAEDIIRSFAESREPDDAVIRDGITYGVARQLRARIEELEGDAAFLRDAAAYDLEHKRASAARIAELEGTLRGQTRAKKGNDR